MSIQKIFRVRAMTLDAARDAFTTVKELGVLLRRGDVTSRQLTQFYLERLDRLGRRWRAVVSLDADGAIKAAEQADALLRDGTDLGPLHGLPYAVKDIFATVPPLPTTWGAAPFRDRQLSADADVIVRLRAAGAILLGKLALIEMAATLPFESFDASVTGACRNPFDLEAWTGDSSSGSASAVAGGLVPFSVATETRGSIVQPSAFCGAVGLRPTVGLVPAGGTLQLSETFDRIGPIARSAEDCALILSALTPQHLSDRKPEAARIGLLRPSPQRDEPEVIANFDAALEHLASFAKVEVFSLPERPYRETYLAIFLFEARRNFLPFIEDGTLDRLSSPLAKGGAYLAEPVAESAYRQALEHRDRLLGEWLEVTADLHAIVTTTTPKVAPPLSATFSAYFGPEEHEPITTVGALLGLPAITIPSGLGSRRLPTGLQLVGRPKDDLLLCQIAGRLQGLLPNIMPPRENVWP
jgi:aspartyl-tRNA(Asn)/glutamyl-tRNA(Gln) amidotransferase subunit A